ncbi:putative extracellular solute-binding protein [[Actinomadura] parvosata subsp. kistnae]|nr:ABC transporter substrate-binding protein [Nonomuraea sp. ATCC 55076]SPL96652.1 putative extracellular solute-binding protein [Actinomadura parvosata subsp. kistnae]
MNASIRLGVAAALAFVTVGCTAAPDEPPPPRPERGTIKVGVMPTADAAPLFVAIEKGYFEQEGLEVQPVTATGAGAMLPQIEAGVLDLGQTDYVTTILAAEHGKRLKIVGASAQAGPAGYALVAAKDSKIGSVRRLKGKTVAVNNLMGAGMLRVIAMLKDAGLDRDDVTFVEKPFPDMPAMLAAGKADAALLAEPYVSTGAAQALLRAVPDTVPGRFTDLPTSGWVTTDKWRSEHPATLAAFRRGLAKGLRAAADRKEVEAVLPAYTKITAAAAPNVSLGAVPTAVDPGRLQRVADLMRQHGYVKSSLDVRALIAEP